MAGESDVRIEPVAGDRLVAVLGDVARLRIEVFAAWPYLYDGSLAYEEGYLREFARADGAVVIIARQGERVVGAATAAPLGEHTREFVPLFAVHGYDPDRVFYCGESVLLPDYRGRGIGNAFFDRREDHARACRGVKGSFSHIAFCSVVRRPDDRRAPAGYRTLDGFWRKRGYVPVEGLVGSYRWKEIGEEEETEKAMQFWARAL